MKLAQETSIIITSNHRLNTTTINNNNNNLTTRNDHNSIDEAISFKSLRKQRSISNRHASILIESGHKNDQVCAELVDTNV